MAADAQQPVDSSVDSPARQAKSPASLSGSLAHWLACQHCDALLHRGDVPVGKVATCPHCGSVMLHHKRKPVQRTLAFSLAGLLLYVPANFMPIMSFELLGNGASNTLFKGVVQLWQQGYFWMAFLVCLCSMVMPLLDLAARVVLSLAMATHQFWHWHRYLLRWVHRFSEWGMLEVYMLGILVAFIKMSDLGRIHLGIALLCFIGLLVSSLGATLSFDAHACWEQLEHSRRQKNSRRRQP